MSFAERLRYIRKLKGLNQSDVSRLLGITQRAYSYYEQGKREPDISALIILSDFFGVSIDDLCRDEPRPTVNIPAPPVNHDREIEMLETVIQMLKGVK